MARLELAHMMMALLVGLLGVFATPASASIWTSLGHPEPGLKDGHMMAYDSESHRLILFGSHTGNPPDDQLWSYNYETASWQDRTASITSPRPAANGHGAFAYDSDTDRIILFGGQTQAGDAPTWAYDANTNTWENRNAVMAPGAPLPIPRFWNAMAYDASCARMIMHGGYGIIDVPWSYDSDNNQWMAHVGSPLPLAMAGLGIAYDSRSQRTILVGNTPAGMETWSYDCNANTWLQMNPPTSPPPLIGIYVAYDSQSDLVILYGGDLTETWGYDSDANVWLNLLPTGQPPANHHASMAYVGPIDQVIFYGGPAPDPPWDTQAYSLSITRAPNLIDGDMPPAAPQNLSATSAGLQANLNWQVPLSDGGRPIEGYRVFRGTEPGALSFLAQTTGSATTYTDELASASDIFIYRVSAFNVVGEGPRGSSASNAGCAANSDFDGDGFVAIACGGDDCNDTNPAIYPGAIEICNGIDDNCIGGIDEGLSVDADLDGFSTLGSCGSGDDCDDGDASIFPGAPEACNARDDDCDGVIDENWPTLTDPCNSGVGACAASGSIACATDATGVVCDAGAGVPATEICEGRIDEDCDGTVDEGCYCTTGNSRPCYGGPSRTEGVGICRGGTQVCADQAWSACEGQTLPAIEQCGDGTDNDCDGEALPCAECVDASGTHVPRSAEVCDDGVDNDCDGLIDRQDTEDCTDASSGGCGCGASGGPGNTSAALILALFAFAALASRRSPVRQGVSRSRRPTSPT